MACSSQRHRPTARRRRPGSRAATSSPRSTATRSASAATSSPRSTGRRSARATISPTSSPAASRGRGSRSPWSATAGSAPSRSPSPPARRRRPGRHSPYDAGVTTPRAPRIKFCGITGLDDAKRAVEAGAWALGLILFPGSPRRCALPDAELIAGTLRRQAEICGVFVNAPLAEVTGTADALGLTMVQLHGDEGPSDRAEVARRTVAKIIKAARVRGGADIRALEAFHTDYLLLDAHQPGRFGGT